MASVLFLIWLLTFFCNAVDSLVYQHSVFQKKNNPAAYNNETSPVFSSIGSTLNGWINKCHSHPSCESVVYDTTTCQCSLYEGKTVREEITSNQVYHQVLTKTVHEDATGFPGVIGCVDGTMIKIVSPSENEADYLCRKGFYAINVQMTCDPQFRVLDVVAKWPGSVHDARIFRESNLCKLMEEVYANQLCSGNDPRYLYIETVPVCYKIDSEPRTMTDAVLFCKESGGHLLRIDTEQKQKFVESITLETTSSISKYRNDGILTGAIWRFSNDRAITRFYWYPEEHADGTSSIALRVEYNGKWDDVQPHILHGSICERDIKFD